MVVMGHIVESSGCIHLPIHFHQTDDWKDMPIYKDKGTSMLTKYHFFLGYDHVGVVMSCN